MSNKPNYYAIIPADVRYDKNISPNAKLLFGEITALTNKTGECWASDNYFADLYGTTKRTVQRWLKELEDNGYIERRVVYKKGISEVENRYISVMTNMSQGYRQKCHKGTDKNVVVNNTRVNNTRVNKDIVELDNSTVPYKEIIEYLNEKANSKYRLVESNKKFIRARWNEGYRLEDFKKVIENKVQEWLNDSKMNQYLRPQTLFGTKFDSYLNTTTKLNSERKGIGEYT